MRHAADQRPVEPGEGPIGLILAPSRELVTQIATEARRLCRAMGLRAAAIYGGASIADQIADLKRGAEVVVATPGRLIELLAMREGRTMALGRVSYVVLDEADRMFDMGFEPQVRGGGCGCERGADAGGDWWVAVCVCGHGCGNSPAGHVAITML